jgi:hypothetical protein
VPQGFTEWLALPMAQQQEQLNSSWIRISPDDISIIIPRQPGSSRSRSPAGDRQGCSSEAGSSEAGSSEAGSSEAGSSSGDDDSTSGSSSSASFLLVDVLRGCCIILADSDDCPDGQLLAVPLSQLPQVAERRRASAALPAQVLVPGQPGVEVQGFAAFHRHLAVLTRASCSSQITVYPLMLDGQQPSQEGQPAAAACCLQLGPAAALDLPLLLGRALDPTAVLKLDAQQGPFTGTTLRVSFSSFITPVTTLDIDLAGLAPAKVHVEPVLAGFDQRCYRSLLEWATSYDGTRVPVTLAYREPPAPGRQQQGPAAEPAAVAPGPQGPRPLVLFVYGAYGYKLHPQFNPAELSLLDRGVVLAVAHVRGGGELGAGWHIQGGLGQGGGCRSGDPSLQAA